jgi:hypothetical protein
MIAGRATLLCLALAACSSEAAEPGSASREQEDVVRTQSALSLHRAKLARDLARDPANVKPVQLAHGARALRIESGFRHVTMVRHEGDGGVRRDCVDTLPGEAAR